MGVVCSAVELYCGVNERHSENLLSGVGTAVPWMMTILHAGRWCWITIHLLVRINEVIWTKPGWVMHACFRAGPHGNTSYDVVQPSCTKGLACFCYRTWFIPSI